MHPSHREFHLPHFPLLSAAIVLLLAGFAPSCGRSAGRTDYRLSLILGSNSDWHRGAARFAELVEKRSGGRLHIRIFPHSQLAGGVQRTELEMLQSGVIDFSLESAILLSLVEKRMSVPCLPWLLPDYRTARAALDGPPGRELLDALEAKGIVGLAYGANGFRQITNSRRPVRTPDDLRNLKIRVPAIRLYIDIFKRLGADPSAMNFGELFTALAQKTMDGQENPAAVILASRLDEVQTYLTVWNYSYDPIVLCVNRRLWESLPSGDRELFSRCARDAMAYESGLVADGERAALDSLRAHGMVVDTLDPQEKEKFRALAEPVYNSPDAAAGSDLIERFRAFSAEETR